jgi:endoglucanase
MMEEKSEASRSRSNRACECSESPWGTGTMSVAWQETIRKTWSAFAVASAFVGALTACQASSRPTDSGFHALARRFFDRYVESNGRVVRLDQGGDTVSEGQAYGLLIALLAGDSAQFATIWSWTNTHLRRPDHLFAWHWEHGGVTDQEPAADADLNIAWALALAGNHFRSTAYQQEATRIARAVIDHETVTLDDQLFLVAGPWARPRAIVNPSYLEPLAFDALATATGDSRWQRLHDASRHLLQTLTAHGLPPDWSRVGPDGNASATVAPDGTEAQYGLDAQRVLVLWSTSCEASDRALGARLWPVLSATDAGRGVVASDLSGSRPRVPSSVRNPLGLVAAAAAARAAGDGLAAHRLSDASLLARAYPTYYGDAWATLGTALLSHTDRCDLARASPR